MARKIDTASINYAAKLVLDGATVKFAAKEIGAHPATISKKLRKIGVTSKRGRGHADRLDLPINEVSTMYQNGESENAISKHFGVDRGTIRKRLLAAGISPRSQSEAEQLKWRKMSKEDRRKQVKAAHDACRGSTRSLAARKAVAVTRQRVKYDHLIGHGEVEFKEFLTQRGIDFTHQQAVYGYNLDFAIGNVAVELSSDRGRYTMFNPKEIKRSKHLLESGYHVVAVDFDRIDTLIECADDVIRFVNQASSLKSTDSEYWVIRCRRKDCTVIKNKLGQFSSVPSPVEFLAQRSVVYFD